MGRQEQPLDPAAGPLQDFAQQLRQLRRTAGNPGYRTLARRAGYSASALSAAASGRLLPSLAVTLAYVGACRGDVADWERRWEEAAVAVGSPEAAPLPVGYPAPATPRQLPPDAYGFVGRGAELARLDALLEATGQDPPAVVISAVAGTGGVGKTALAVHWAHRVADRFPDGQLYVNLRGYDPDQPLDPADVLAAFLRALGVPGADVPYEPAERAARYRTVLAGRRILVLLDNAHSAEQVRPLLPGAASCFVLVTSRDSLGALVAGHGARRLDLDLLPGAEAVALLRTLVGERVDARPEAAVALAQRCARLPLALRLAAEMAAGRPASTVDDLLAELADEHRRLDLLDAAADGRTALRAVFSWSYRRLPPGAARVFRLLGLHPGEDLDNLAAAAMAGERPDAVELLVDLLVRAHLVQRAPTGRLRLHDLLRAYAAELAAGDAERRDAQTRLFDYYLAACADAVDTLYPGQIHRRPRVPRPGTPLPAVDEPARALAWLDAERANLVAAVAHTAGHGWPDHTDMFVATINYYFENCGHHAESAVVARHMLTTARQQGNARAEGDALFRLGTVACKSGRHAEAAEHYRGALDIRRGLGDDAAVGRTVNNLANVYLQWGSYAEAGRWFHESLDNQRAVGDRDGIGVALLNLGILHERLGDNQTALDYYLRAGAAFGDAGGAYVTGSVLAATVAVLGRLGRFAEAADAFDRAVGMLREVGDRDGEASALANRGVALMHEGRGAEAAGHLEQALAIIRATGSQIGEVEILDYVGEVYRQVGRYGEALTHQRRALRLARRSGERGRETSVLNGIGETLDAIGHVDEAGLHFSAAARQAREIGDVNQEARALDGMARLRPTDSRPDLAHGR